MKIRFGFVSNSSSTSFCMVAYLFTEPDTDDNKGAIKELYEKYIKNNPGSEWSDFIDWLNVKIYNYCELKNKPLYYKDRLILREGIDEYCGCWILGRNIEELKDHVTLGEFKDNITNELNECFKEDGVTFNSTKMSICVDGGEN